MDRNDFANRLKALHSIDRDELIAAGLGHMADDRNWVAFREKPAAWLLNTEEHNAMAVWALVESRCAPADPKDAPHVLDGLLEPVTKNAAGLGVKNIAEGAALSQAISLKRIADAMTGNDPGVCDTFHDLGLNFRQGWERAG